MSVRLFLATLALTALFAFCGAFTVTGQVELRQGTAPSHGAADAARAVTLAARGGPG